MFGIPNVFKKKKVESTKTSQKVTATSTTEIEQAVPEVGNTGAEKLDFSDRFKTFLSGIRSSMTGTWYRIKSVVMPGRRVSSEAVTYFEKIYNNLNTEDEELSTSVKLIRGSQAGFDGLNLEPLEVGDSAEGSPQKVSVLTSEFNAFAARLAEQERESNSLWPTRGFWNILTGRKSSEENVETKLVQENASNAEAFCENGEALAEQAKSESKLSLMDRLKGWFSKSKKESDTINESVEDKLVHGETDSAEPNENKFEEGASFTGELDVKEEDTLSIAKPELSEREKSGPFQRFITFVTNLFSTKATESSGFVETHHDASSVNSLDLSSGQTPAALTPPPSYYAATQGQSNAMHWRKRFSSKATEKSFEKRLEKEGTAVDEKEVRHTLV